MNAPLFESLKAHLSIPERFGLGHAGGEVRILIAGALLNLEFREELLGELGECKHMAQYFRQHPIKQDDLIGALLAERPLLAEGEFIAFWEANGLRLALARVEPNPMFQDHMTLFLFALIAFCSIHRLNTHARVPQRYFDHLRMLRYLLYASC